MPEAYTRREIIFHNKIGLDEFLRLAASLLEGGKIGSVEIRLWGEIPNIRDNPIDYLRFRLATVIPLIDFQAKGIGVEAWFPVNDQSTVDDFFDFFVKRLRDDGPRTSEGTAVSAYRQRVKEWSENQN